MRWLSRLALCLAAMAASGVAGAAMQVLVIAGLGGEPQYDERFAKWSEQVELASQTATGDAARVRRLVGREATSAAIESALRGIAGELNAADQFMLVLLGHGSFDGSEYRFNITGPDLTGSQIGALLDRIPSGVSQLIINATSASGATVEKWAKPQRVVIAATKTGGQRNATRFGGYWTEALGSDEADFDKDGNITAKEAYEFAVRKVADSFKSDAAVLTENARITGNDAARFVVARRGAAALFASDTQLLALRGEQGAIEQRITDLRARKPDLAEDDYYSQLEPVLLDLARLGARIDARLAALGAGGSGDRK